MTSDNGGSQMVSRSRATMAGRFLRNGLIAGRESEYAQALAVAQQWRAQHAEPTERCFEQVLECSRQMPDSVSTYRLKRMISIIRKLQRPNAHFKLGELDDIGGCRLIVETNDQVNQAATWLASKLPLKNGSGNKDYIARPQNSGYRSRHLLCKVESGSAAYHVEVQIRTQLQHCWATAVEAAGEIYGTEYKSPTVRAAAEGADEDRLTFFRIVSSLFALEEHSPQIPGYEGDHTSLVTRLRALTCTDDLLNDLQTANDSIFVVNDSRLGEELFLMKLSREDQYLDIESFPMNRLDEALRQYDAVERQAERASEEDGSSKGFIYDNAVLVFASDRTKLNVAYPNYSTNVKYFLDKVSAYLP